MNNNLVTIVDIHTFACRLAVELAALHVVVSVSAVGLDGVEYWAVDACRYGFIVKRIGREVFYLSLIQVACQRLNELHVAALFANGLVVLRLIESPEGGDISRAFSF